MATSGNINPEGTIRCSHCGFDNNRGELFCKQCGAPIPTDVFISYSRKDYVDEENNVIPGNIITQIKNSLLENGISYWFDEEGIYSGDEFASVITRAIRETSVFLFISSVNSNKSHWTSNEISTALEFNKVIIPVRIDDTPYNDSIMMKIISLDYVDCRVNKAKAIEKVLRAIRRNLHRGHSFEIPSGNEEIAPESPAPEITPIINKKSSSDKQFEPESFIIDENSIHFVQEPLSYRDISVNITDQVTPLAVLVGPPCVGKTMTWVRLARYLVEQGYVIQPNQAFRDSSDSTYKEICNSFQMMVNSAYAIEGTDLLSCLLMNVKNNTGESILQIVDMAGELFLRDLTSLPLYFNQICNTSNPKIWIIILEPLWQDFAERRMSTDIIRSYQKRFMRPRDKVIILYNKVDKTDLLEGRDKVNNNLLYRRVAEEYPGLLNLFKNTSLLRSLVNRFSCDILPFMTGTYSEDSTGQLLYSPSPSYFPRLLWDSIQRFHY